jgi:hypothetical protein
MVRLAREYLLGDVVFDYFLGVQVGKKLNE